MAERVRWQDLAHLSPRERIAELLLPLPWLVLAWSCAAAGWTLLAVLAVAPFFTAALRLTHDTFHRNLGLARREGDLLLFALSLLLGGALHAIEHTHLHHHRNCLAADDVEGRIAGYGFWAALLRSPAYPLLIHVETLRRGSARQRRWVRRELAAVAALQTLIWCGGDAGLQTLAISLIAANALVPMIGIWSVHRGCASAGRTARSSRSGWLQWLSFNMLYHDEHHACPAVPARHLPRLAQRLDAAGRHAAPDVIGAPSGITHRVASGLLAAAVMLSGCRARSAAQTEIDACALARGAAARLIARPLALAEPREGSLAGACLMRGTGTDDAVQLAVYVHTAAAARRHDASLERSWRLLVAEARNSHGAGRTLRFRRSRDGESFGFARAGSGQVLVLGRGLILEVGARGLAPDQAETVAAELWSMLLRG
ncbi:MAG TPA: fatty acid desaturase [Tahibacter sp.]|uniref:fatty acid desaturase n=1 Tax=Tahibacter sp. TaxID=2056211 RepID=UPI002BA12788|nr:fatty acid desaturase [Tahibacter sp.]HSX59361.1 fatty acid desaturase [Tahibacter sp.]